MNEYMSLLAKAEEMANLYFKGDSINADLEIKKERLNAVRNCYYLAIKSSEYLPETVINYADFIVKSMSLDINKSNLPCSTTAKSNYINNYLSEMDRLVGDAKARDKTILTKKKKELLTVLEEVICKHDEQWNIEFTKRLSNAKEIERQFLEACASGHGNLEEDKAVLNSYMDALDAAGKESIEEKEVDLLLSDFFYKKFLLSIPQMKKQIDNRPITQAEVKVLTDAILCTLNDSIAKNDKNKAAYVKKKEELIAAVNEELRKNKIEVKSGDCYIATSIYGSYDCPQVLILRSYRDNKLAKSILGRFFVCTYYAVSPQIVKWFGKNVWFKRFGRRVLDKLVKNL